MLPFLNLNHNHLPVFLSCGLSPGFIVFSATVFSPYRIPLKNGTNTVITLLPSIIFKYIFTKQICFFLK